MSLEQYKDANRKELWEILQIQVERIAELEAIIRGRDELINNAVSSRIAELEDQWISVDDEMPSAEHAMVIVDFYGGNVGVGYSHKGKILDEPMGMLFNGVTHWMPLPKPPKDQE